VKSEQAVCASVDPDLWFPEDATSIFSPVYLMCSTCPVQRECLKYSFDHREEFGVWGGVSESQREKLLPTYFRRGMGGRERMLDRLLSERNEQIIAALESVEENYRRYLERKRVKNREQRARRKARLEANHAA
jgi:hypothetical protein